MKAEIWPCSSYNYIINVSIKGWMSLNKLVLKSLAKNWLKCCWALKVKYKPLSIKHYGFSLFQHIHPNIPFHLPQWLIFLITVLNWLFKGELPPYYKPWMDISLQIPDLVKSQELRSRISKVSSDNDLTSHCILDTLNVYMEPRFSTKCIFRCRCWVASSCRITESYGWPTWPSAWWRWATPGRTERRTQLRYQRGSQTTFDILEFYIVFLQWNCGKSQKFAEIANLLVIVLYNF